MPAWCSEVLGGSGLKEKQWWACPNLVPSGGLSWDLQGRPAAQAHTCRLLSTPPTPSSSCDEVPDAPPSKGTQRAPTAAVQRSLTPVPVCQMSAPACSMMSSSSPSESASVVCRCSGVRGGPAGSAAADAVAAGLARGVCR